jgi:hypothetical protein
MAESVDISDLLVGMHVEFMEGVDAEATSWELEVTN